MADPIYLDYQATTPLAPEAFAAMRPWLEDGFANPHSAHAMGRRAAAAVEVARGQLAALFPDSGEVIFTSGATEALNLALIGGSAPTGRRRIITLVSEHAAVRDTCLWLERQGWALDMLPVQSDGLLDLDRLEQAMGDDVAMVAAMLVNNEIGVIQSVAEIADIAHRHGALMLCDAVQGYGRMMLPEGPDLIAVSGHKIHGPKGIGALWRRSGTRLNPILHGGGQEQGVRSGTLSPALCAGFGAAAKLAGQQMQTDHAHIAALAERLCGHFADWAVNGSLEHRYPGNLNLRRDGLDVARLMSDVRGVAFSAGSACASGSGRPSHVLTALGLDSAQTKASIRLGFGRYSSAEEIDRAAALILEAAAAQ